MDEGGHRQLGRDSLFVMAELRLDGSNEIQRVKVRNLSSGGLMADGATMVSLGQLLKINIKNIGWVSGSIAWVQGNRCGVAFHHEIDPKIVRMGSPAGSDQPMLVRRPAASLSHAEQASLLRKV